jgi:hypothetical protein
VSYSPASNALAEEFTIIPYPFSGTAREELEAEYALLLSSGARPTEISDMILYALEILLNKRKKEKDQAKYDQLTLQLSDMLGRLAVYEETFLNPKHRYKSKK